MRLSKRFKKVLRTKVWPYNRKFKAKIVATPDKYKKLVHRIYQESPIWGSHQTIRFPDGFILKGGRDESRINKFGLPSDLSGMTVIDIGCNIGTHCIECKKRNASKVIGLDKNAKLLIPAKEIADVFGLDIEYKKFDIMVDNIEEKFDIVFFLNVFHHLSEQGKIRSLRMVDEITKKYMFFESPSKGDLVASSEKGFYVEDYLSYIKGFTNFDNIEFLGNTDFNRPLIKCSR